MLSLDELDAKIKRLEVALSKCLTDEERLRIRHAISNVLCVKSFILAGHLKGYKK
jgi:L-ribulose-5-phosphate 3-epimerase UlaE